MSCTLSRLAAIFGRRPSFSRSRAITASTPSLASRALSTTDILPALGVELTVPTPTTLVTPATSACSFDISSKDTVGSAVVIAEIRPVSCGGRKPLGAAT